MLLPEQLYASIPKKITQWTSKDVKLWFSLHSILINPSFNFEQQNFDGPTFLKVTPQYLNSQLGISSIILIKKIYEWLEQDLEQFEQYVQSQNSQNAPKKEETQKQIQISMEECIISEPNKENTPKNNQFQIQQTKHHQAIKPIKPIQNVKKWNQAKKKSISYEQKKGNLTEDCKDVSQSSQSRAFSNDVKLVESQYEYCETFLRFEYKTQVIILRKSGKIGRNIAVCDVNIIQDSVSRQHAQIVRIDNQYYIKDIGSRFGTFFEISNQKNRVLKEGNILSFEDSQLQIQYLKIYTQKNNFDIRLKLTTDKTTILTFYSQKQLTIGRKNCKININDQRISLHHAKIILNSNQRPCLFKQEGQCFFKLKNHELYQLQNDQIVLFGLQKVKVSVISKSKHLNKISEFLIQQ